MTQSYVGGVCAVLTLFVLTHVLCTYTVVLWSPGLCVVWERAGLDAWNLWQHQAHGYDRFP